MKTYPLPLPESLYDEAAVVAQRCRQSLAQTLREAVHFGLPKVEAAKARSLPAVAGDIPPRPLSPDEFRAAVARHTVKMRVPWAQIRRQTREL